MSLLQLQRRRIFFVRRPNLVRSSAVPPPLSRFVADRPCGLYQSVAAPRFRNYRFRVEQPGLAVIAE
jgi:hypothetical protein